MALILNLEKIVINKITFGCQKSLDGQAKKMFQYIGENCKLAI